MQDRVPLYPGRVKLVPVAGQEYTYDMKRADQPTQPGDPLSKNTLFSDDAASLYPGASLPSEALKIIGRFNLSLGNEYLWKKTKTTGKYEYTDTRYDTTDYAANLLVNGQPWPKTLYYADDFKITGDNRFELVEKKSLSVDFETVGNTAQYDALKGKYVESPAVYGEGATIFKIAQNATFTWDSSYLRGIPCNRYTNPTIVYETTVEGYLNSPNRDTYPDQPSAGYELGDVQSGKFYFWEAGGNAPQYTYADSVSVTSGNIVLNGGITIYANKLNDVKKMLGKFFILSNQNGAFPYFKSNAVYYVPDNANINEDSVGILTSKYQDVTMPLSYDSIEYMGQLGDKARVVTGSYVGTGTYGKDNPNRVSLPGKARVFSVAVNYKSIAEGSSGNGGIWVEPSSLMAPFSSSNNYEVPFTASNDGVEWFTPSSSMRQYNSEGYTYFYFAIL